MGSVPNMEAALAQQLVNRAWHDIIENPRMWSWLRGTGVLIAPQNITGGTVSVTQYSATVTLDTNANAALNNLTFPLITQRQFRSGQGPVYNIAAYNHGAGTLTLDRLYMESSATGQSFQVYQCYYQPTDGSGAVISDFSKFKAILNPVDGYAIVGPNLNLTRQELDARDPTRGAQDLAYCIAAYTVGSNGIPFYELWPHPTAQRGYIHLYQKKGIDLSATNDIPATLSKDLVIQRALYYGYDWAIANMGRFANLKGVNWALLKAENLRAYEKMLQAGKDQGRRADSRYVYAAVAGLSLSADYRQQVFPESRCQRLFLELRRLYGKRSNVFTVSQRNGFDSERERRRREYHGSQSVPGLFQAA